MIQKLRTPYLHPPTAQHDYIACQPGLRGTAPLGASWLPVEPRLRAAPSSPSRYPSSVSTEPCRLVDALSAFSAAAC